VEAVGPSDDQPTVFVQSFRAGVVDLQWDGGEDLLAALAEGLGDLDERGPSGAVGPGAPAVNELDGLVGIQVAVDDHSEGFLHAVGAPQVASSVAGPAQCRGLGVGEVFGAFEQ
jgi:hypothetical protein